MKKTKQTITVGLIGAHLCVEAMKLLHARGGSMPGSQLITYMKENINRLCSFLPADAHETYSSQTMPKWATWLLYSVIHFGAAGLIRREKKVWYLEQEGEKHLRKGTSVEELMAIARRAYSAHSAKKKTGSGHTISPEQDSGEGYTDISREIADVANTIARLREQGRRSLQAHIKNLDPYEFQDFCEALLKAMGYYVTDKAPKGKDGGVDLIAYKDPFGASGPRLKVQVKAYSNPVGAQPVRELSGLLTEGEIGVFICTAGFTRDAVEYARNTHKHIRLINGDELLSLWLEFYDQISREDQSFLPVTTVQFLDEKRIIDE